MKSIQISDVQQLSNIIYRLHNNENDLENLCRTFMEQFSLLVPYAKAATLLSSTHQLSEMDIAIGRGFNDIDISNYSIDLFDKDYTNWMYLDSKTEVYRETDFFSDELREKTEYYKRVYKENGVHYSVQITLYCENLFLGVITFFRRHGQPDFSDQDMFYLNIIKSHLALSIFHAMTEDISSAGENDFTGAMGLTIRESEVVQELITGSPTEIIAEKLCISTFTVRKHIANIYKKLNVNSRSELILIFNEMKRQSCQ